MTSQEEWRKIAYDESVGRSGNNSIGTMANARGYQEYLEQRRRTESIPPPMVHVPNDTYGGGVDRGVGVGGGPSSGEGAMEAVGGGLANISEWFVERIWPLRMVSELGGWIAATGLKVRLPVAVLGAYLSAVLLTSSAGPAAWPQGQTLLADLAGQHAIWIAVGLGALAGWIAVPLVGALLVLSAHLVGLALGVATIGAVLAVVYVIVAAVAGWPPFDGAVASGPVE